MMKCGVTLVFVGMAALLAACDEAPCEDVDCSGHGDCVVEDGKALCQCEQGYGVSPDGKECAPVVYEPLIYLYPPHEMQVSVRFADVEGVRLLHSYPRYGDDGWQVLASPDGTLEDSRTGLEHYALFYEAACRVPPEDDRGFVVPGEETAAFLEQKLGELGLTRREANEFIVFWLPRLEPQPYNFIHFSTSGWNELVPLDIHPSPDTLLRVFMLHKPLDEPISVEPQALYPVTRRGFTVVEWGGGRAD